MGKTFIAAALASALLTVGAAAAAPRTTSAQSARVRAMLGDADLVRVAPEPVSVHPGKVDLRPDLVVTDVTWNPASYLPPASMHVIVAITNNGPADAGPFALV